tara:strand:+ start:61 stop:555 length:495 start_codon:yes stop_codon:yes gene_type:complete
MKKFNTTLLMLFSISSFLGQKNWTVFPEKKDSIQVVQTNLQPTLVDSSKKELNFNKLNGSVKVISDPRIEIIQNNLIDGGEMNGYTVQIEVSQQNNIIKDAKLKFIKAYPDESIFDEYIAPNTYLFVGKFYDKNDALHFKYKIRDLFPNTMVIKKPIAPPVFKN